MLTIIVSALTFLINTITDLYVFLLIARLILVWVHSDRYNYFMRLIDQLTGKIVVKLKPYLPDSKGIELSTLFLIISIECVKFLLLSLLTLTLPNILGLLVLSIAETFKLTLNVFFYGILLQVILSWLPNGYHDAYAVLAALTAPVMRPIRRMVRPVNGLDISPIPALISLQLIVILVVNPLFSLGMHLTFG